MFDLWSSVCNVPTSEHKIVGCGFPETMRSKQGRSSAANEERTVLIVNNVWAADKLNRHDIDGSIMTETP